jgi:hypothetical protein
MRAVARAAVALAGARVSWVSGGTDKRVAAAPDRAEATIRAAGRDADAGGFSDPRRARTVPPACAAGRDTRPAGTARACSRERVRRLQAVVAGFVLGTAVQRQRNSRSSATQERPPGPSGLPTGRAPRHGNQEGSEGGSQQGPQREENPCCPARRFGRIVRHCVALLPNPTRDDVAKRGPGRPPVRPREIRHATVTRLGIL